MSERIFTVLTIDGGGVRGIMTARLLQEIEERTGKSVSELFDLIAGSSTGAILAGSLCAPDPQNPGKPLYSAEDMKNFYLQDAATIFPPSRNRQLKHFVPGMSGFFNPAPFEKILEDRLGDTTMGDSLNCLMIAGSDMKAYRPVWMSTFKNMGKRPDLPQKWESLKLRDAIRASASPPTIFPAKYIYTQPNKSTPQAHERHAFLDGSMFAATISRSAHTFARKIAPENARIVVASLGTGYIESSLTPDQMNKMSPISWALTMMSASIDFTIQETLKNLRAEIGDDLMRFDAKIDPQDVDAPDMGLTCAKPENLAKLLKATEKMIDKHDDKIDVLCEILLARLHIESELKIKTEASSKKGGLLSKFNPFKGKKSKKIKGQNDNNAPKAKNNRFSPRK